MKQKYKLGIMADVRVEGHTIEGTGRTVEGAVTSALRKYLGGRHRRSRLTDVKMLMDETPRSGIALTKSGHRFRYWWTKK